MRQRDAVSFALRQDTGSSLTLNDLPSGDSAASGESTLEAERRALEEERRAIEAALAEVDDDDDDDDEWDNMSPQEQALRLDIERAQLEIETRGFFLKKKL